MNKLWADPMLFRYSVIGMVAVVVAWILLLLSKWYAGLLLLVPVSTLNSYQFLQCLRWRKNHKE